MRIARYYETGAADVFRLEKADRPRPGLGAVLVRVQAIAVHFAEIQLRQGKFVGGATPLPRAPGSDVAGIVDSVGESVAGFSAGDPVVASVADSGYADYVSVPAQALIRVPIGLDPKQAVTLLPTPGQVAFHVVKTMGQLKAGETVLVHAAAGGIGHLIVQIAKALGAAKVIAASSTRTKLDFARSCGADVAVDYTQSDWLEQVRATNAGRGVDLVLHSSGATVLKQSVGLLAPLGRLVFYGWADDGTPGMPSVSLIELLLGLRYATGFKLGALQAARPDLVENGLRELLSLVASGKVKPAVHAAVPLENVAEAHRIVESRECTGRVVLIP